MLVALAALPLVAAPVQAQSASTHVSNINQSQTSTWQLSTHDMAVKFTTGSHQAGYALSDIEIRFHTAPTGLSVKLTSGLPTAGSPPATTVTLANPATLTNSVNKFSAPAGTTLAAETDYWVVLEGSAGGPRGTSSDNEDAGASAGWSVGNSTRWRTRDSTGSWSTSTNALMIRVNGSAEVTSSVSDVAIVSTPRLPASGTKTTYGSGQNIVVGVTWDALVTWDVSATNAGIRVNLDVGGTTKHAELVTNGATSGTAQTLWFSYDVVSGDSDTDGVEVTPDGDGNLVMLRNNATLAGVSGSATVTHAGLAADAGHLVDGSKSAPASTNAAPTAATINGNTATLTFSESLLPALDDTNEEPGAIEGSTLERLRWAFSLDGVYRSGGVRMRNVVPTHVAVSGSTVTLTTGSAKALPGSTDVSVSYSASMAGAVGAVLRDPNGSDLPSFDLPTASVPVTNNTTGTVLPLLASAQVAGTELTLTFDKALDMSSTPAGDRFTVRHTADHWHSGSDDVRGTMVTVSGSTVTVTLPSRVPQDRFAMVSYSKPSSNPLRDAASTDAEVGDIEWHQATVLDRDPPPYTRGLLVGSTLTLYYGDTLDTGSTPTASAFTVTAGSNTHSVSGVSVHPNAVKLTLGSTPTSDVTVTYSVPTSGPIQDVAGNDASALNNESVARQNSDPGAPSLTSASAAGAVVSLSFSQRLDPASVPPASAFGFAYTEYDGETPRGAFWEVTDVAVTGTNVELTVSPGWYPCVSSVQVTYTAPTGTGAMPLQNLWGTAAQSPATNRGVVNTRRNHCIYNVPVASMGPSGNSGDGSPQSGSGGPPKSANSQMSLQFDQPLSTRSVPKRQSFTVTPDGPGAPVEVENARLSDDARQILLGLSRALDGGEGFTVNYRRPRGAPGLWTDDGRQLADFSSQAVVPVPNRAPTFDSWAPGRVNAPPGVLVSAPVSQADFSDPDGDELTFALTANRDDTFVAGDVEYIDAVGRVFFAAKTACALAGVDLPAGGVVDTVVTMTATDPDGESAQVDVTFRTDLSGFGCPSVSSVAVDGDAVTIELDADLAGSYRLVPTASEFAVSVNGVAVGLAPDAVSAGGSTITLTLAEPVRADQTVTVSYVPGDFPVAAAFADQPAVNGTAEPVNRAPVFGGRAPAWVNAPPGFLVSLPVRQADFSDPDGDELTFTLTANRNDTYVAGDLSYIDWVGRVFFAAKTACALADIDVPSGGIVDTVVTMTATDPGGLSAQVSVTFRTNPSDFACPSVSNATVDGDTVTIELDADLARSYQLVPTASEFAVHVDGVAATLAADAASASGSTITLTLPEAVTADQTVTVSYTPGDFPVAEAFTNQTVTNNTPPVEIPADEPTAEQDASALGDAVLAGLTVNGNELILTFHQDLTAMDDAAARAPRFAFLVQGAYRHGILISNQSPNQVVVDGATVTLTLGVGIPAGHEVTVSYSAAAAGNRLRYADGTAIASFDSTLTTTQQG